VKACCHCEVAERLAVAIQLVVIFCLLFFPAFAFANCRVSERIVSLAPDITESLFAVGAGKQVVGVMQGSDYPPAAQKIPVVAAFDHIDTERLLKMQPDLIVAWAVGRLPHALRRLKIPVYFVHPEKLQDIPHTLRQLGCLSGHQKKADAAALIFESGIAALKKSHQGVRKIRVFYEVWSHPLMTITRASWINDVIELCGGENVFAGLSGVAPVVDREAVLSAHPEVVATTATQAVWSPKGIPVIRLEADMIDRAGPRLLLAARALCRELQP